MFKSEMNIVQAWLLFLQLQLKLQTSSMFKGKKDNYPFSVCRPFVDTRIGEQVNFFLLCAAEIHINTHCDFFLNLGVEDINIKVLQMIQHEHMKVNCSFLFVFMLFTLTLFLHHSTASRW